MPAFLLGFVLALLPINAFAQLLSYSPITRPLGVRYQVLQTDHFDIVFEQGYLNEAKAAVLVLNRHLSETKGLLQHGHKLHMPVVLNGFNDLSNGFVTPLPFKQEIEISNLKGKTLSPSHVSWMDTVLPHELVHAVQGDMRKGFGVGAILRPFAPDFARTLNFLIPQGISEGVAVYYESKHREGAGRLNHSFFTMRFRAAMASRKPWSMAQLVEMPAYSRPFDRFYLGGAHFVDFLAKRDSLDFFHRSTALNYRIPFLGYGIGLWYGAKKWPARVYRDFVAQIEEREDGLLSNLGDFTAYKVVSSKKGRVHRRPKWLNDEEILVYASGYALRGGFYVFNIKSGQKRLIRTTRSTEDYVYALSDDKEQLYYARYVTDPLVSIKNTADLFRLDLNTGDEQQLTNQKRLLAPSLGHTFDLLALQNDGQGNQIVAVSSAGEIDVLSDFDNVRIQELQVSPDGNSLIGLIGIAGMQSIFGVSLLQGDITLQPLVEHPGGPIFDMSWSPDGEYLLYTAEEKGISNVFAFDVDEGVSRQLTNVRYGAMEPDLSPDGKTLAYINYEHEKFELVLMPFAPDRGALVETGAQASRKITSSSVAEIADVKLPDSNTQLRKYRPFAHLRPRTFFPIFESAPENIFGDKEIGAKYGVVLQGADPLQRLAYRVEGYTLAGKGWGEATMQFGGAGIQPFVSGYNTLTTVTAGLRYEEGDTVELVRGGRQRRGVSAGFVMPVLFHRNVFQSGMVLRFEGEFEQERFYTSDDIPFNNQQTLEPGASFFYRLQSNPRDLIPNNGIVLTVNSSLDIKNDAFEKNKAMIARLTAYLPFLRQSNIGLRTYAYFLTQNNSSIYNLDTFLPRGYKDDFVLGSGNHIVAGVEYVQPLWYVDNGFFMVPLYVKALYAFGFAEALFDSGGNFESVKYNSKEAISTGVGIGLRFRMFYLFDFDLRFSAAYKHADRTWDYFLQ